MRVLLFERPEWYDRANCAGVGPARFYVERGADPLPATRICDGCEVRAECLALAMERHEVYGIWGGAQVRTRRRLRVAS